jgi:hypothetical protein
MDGDAYNGISQRFKDGRGEHEEKDPHIVMLSGVLSTYKKKRELLPFSGMRRTGRLIHFPAAP